MTDVEKPRAKPGLKCPLWRKDMSKVCHTCEFWTHVRGRHPQSGEEMDQWHCAITWMPLLMIENSQMQRQTGAAVESFRNEMVRQNNALTGQMRQVSDESVNAYIAPPDEGQHGRNSQ